MSKFTESFRKVIDTIDPQANSLMSKDDPPVVKILADWGRNACDKIEQLHTENDRLKEALAEKGKYGYSQQVVDALTNERDKLKLAYDHAIDGLNQVIKSLEAAQPESFKETIEELKKQIEECEQLKL